MKLWTLMVATLIMVMVLVGELPAQASVDSISGTLSSTYKLINGVQNDHIVLTISGQLLNGHRYRTKGVGYTGVHQYALFLDNNQHVISSRDTVVLDVDGPGPLDPEVSYWVDYPEPLTNLPAGTKYVQWRYYTNLQSYVPGGNQDTSDWYMETDTQLAIIT